MSLWLREDRILGLALTGAAWETGEGEIATNAAVLSVPGHSLAEATPVLRDVLQAALSLARGAIPAGGARHRVVMADSLARYWLMVPPADAGSLKELQQVAQVRCSQLFGGLPGNWVLAGDWDASRPFVCAALPRWIVDMVHARWASRPALCTVLSLLMNKMQAVFPRTGWCCLNAPGHGVVLGFDGGQVVSLRVTPWTAGTDSAARRDGLVIELQRESLRGRLPIGDMVSWVGLEQCLPDVKSMPGVRFGPVPFPWGTQPVPGCLPADEAAMAVWVARQSRMGN